MPMQSGSDAVLRAMRRSYRQERYLGDHRRGARGDARTPRSPPTSSSASPARPRTTSSRRWTSCAQARFARAFTFQYSKRPGTPAADMPDQVPKAVVQERYERLIALQDEISWDANRALVGTEVEVLVSTGEGRKDAATGPGLRPRARRPAGARRGRRLRRSAPGDVVTAVVTYAAPHHLVADGRSHVATGRWRGGEATGPRQSPAGLPGRRCSRHRHGAAPTSAGADRLERRVRWAAARGGAATSCSALRDPRRRRRTCGPARASASASVRRSRMAARNGLDSRRCLRATRRRRRRAPAARRRASARRCAASPRAARARSRRSAPGGRAARSARPCGSPSVERLGLGDDRLLLALVRRPARRRARRTRPMRRAKKASCAARNRAHSASSTSRRRAAGRLPLGHQVAHLRRRSPSSPTTRTAPRPARPASP